MRQWDGAGRGRRGRGASGGRSRGDPAQLSGRQAAFVAVLGDTASLFLASHPELVTSATLLWPQPWRHPQLPSRMREPSQRTCSSCFLLLGAAPVSGGFITSRPVPHAGLSSWSSPGRLPCRGRSGFVTWNERRACLSSFESAGLDATGVGLGANPVQSGPGRFLCDPGLVS